MIDEWEAVSADAIAVMDKAEKTIDALMKRNAALTELLRDVRDSIEGFVDVVDGPEGYESNQRPNWAMSLTRDIDELIGED